MISAESKNLAACSANFIISTAPTEKFGTTRTFGNISAGRPTSTGVSAMIPVTWASLAASKPDVPITTFLPWRRHQVRLSITVAGLVKSTTTSHSASASRESPMSTSALNSRSSAASTVRQTSDPMRPFAPSTPTLIIFDLRLASDGLREQVGVVIRPDYSQGLWTSEYRLSHVAHVVESDRVNPGEDLVNGLQPRVDQLGLA